MVEGHRTTWTDSLPPGYRIVLFWIVFLIGSTPIVVAAQGTRSGPCDDLLFSCIPDDAFDSVKQRGLLRGLDLDSAAGINAEHVWFSEAPFYANSKFVAIRRVDAEKLGVFESEGLAGQRGVWRGERSIPPEYLLYGHSRAARYNQTTQKKEAVWRLHPESSRALTQPFAHSGELSTVYASAVDQSPHSFSFPGSQAPVHSSGVPRLGRKASIVGGSIIATLALAEAVQAGDPYRIASSATDVVNPAPVSPFQLSENFQLELATQGDIGVAAWITPIRTMADFGAGVGWLGSQTAEIAFGWTVPKGEPQPDPTVWSPWQALRQRQQWRERNRTPR